MLPLRKDAPGTQGQDNVRKPESRTWRGDRHDARGAGGARERITEEREWALGEKRVSAPIAAETTGASGGMSGTSPVSAWLWQTALQGRAWAVSWEWVCEPGTGTRPVPTQTGEAARTRA